MILYFDNYITDQPFHGVKHEGVESRRVPGTPYEFQDKLSITLYTLASYAEIEWTAVIIKYELEDPSKKKFFEKQVKKLFPKAHIIYGRSDNQKKFQESIKIMDKYDDDWIFYAGNNDHPFVAPNKRVLNICLDKAKELAKGYKYVTIPLSHFIQFTNMPRKGSPYREINHHDVKLLEETEDYLIAKYPNGQDHSMQIVHRELFRYWFFSKDVGDALIRRSECMSPFIKQKKQIAVIPKKELCAHYDGEVFRTRDGWALSKDLVPPLFIPPSFFEGKIKIAFGYEDYRKGWVNINPAKENYSYSEKEDKTDLKISFEDIPLFWKKKIEKLDINPNRDEGKIEKALKERREEFKQPFPKKGQLYYAFHRFKLEAFHSFYKMYFTRRFFLYLLKKSKRLEGIYHGLHKVSLD